tara:strand:+ start:134 stop:535 length:402 start_codon:yes stop_codon:yes gene_type:complete
MKKLLLSIICLPTILLSQSIELNYTHVKINGFDSVTVESKTSVNFLNGYTILQTEDERIYSYLVPGSEFSDLNYRVFFDMETRLASEDSTEKILLFGSINTPNEVGIVYSGNLNDSLRFIKKTGEHLIFINKE